MTTVVKTKEVVVHVYRVQDEFQYHGTMAGPADEQLEQLARSMAIRRARRVKRWGKGVTVIAVGPYEVKDK